MAGDSCFLDVEWSEADMPGLPRKIGFDTAAEAEQWAGCNAARAAWTIHPLAHPYARSSTETGVRDARI